jgi:hypothetical protein
MELFFRYLKIFRLNKGTFTGFDLDNSAGSGRPGEGKPDWKKKKGAGIPLPPLVRETALPKEKRGGDTLPPLVLKGNR